MNKTCQSLHCCSLFRVWECCPSGRNGVCCLQSDLCTSQCSEYHCGWQGGTWGTTETLRGWLISSMLCYWWEAGSPCTFSSPLRTRLLEHWNLSVPKLILWHSSAQGGWNSTGTGLSKPGVMQCFMLWAWLSIASLPAALVTPVSGTSFLLQLLYPNVLYNMEEFSSEAFFPW